VLPFLALYTDRGLRVACGVRDEANTGLVIRLPFVSLVLLQHGVLPHSDDVFIVLSRGRNSFIGW
jgi:hypothetical protein